ncbi:MAG: asparagine synthase (glutamine-hydrolyzing) [Gemmatimonadota bacterium]|nr:asparagine synthase (glutamine-hydrolyzing) [Gemmatimonadota bacterium]
MCGFAGIVTTASLRREALEAIADTMSARIVHRGPDDKGSWTEPSAGVAFGFRRLAIIDLTAQGHQPMSSASGRYTLVFNGEIFNYEQLKRPLEIEGWHFSGHSDTEVICAAFERWGIEVAVRKFIGMFAIAVWDAVDRRLSLIRDRLGIKPLFYYHRPGILSFGSELKALVAGPDFDASLDINALAAYLRYLSVPAPQTIYRHVRKLLPGHILSVKSVTDSLPDSVAYWSLSDAYRMGRQNTFEGTDSEAVQELAALLTDAVRLRMQADVPLGALLSGGIDSSTIVALMQANSSRPTRTFSIAFPGTDYDESIHAARIAKRLGTDHTEMAVTGGDALAIVPRLPELFDEPFADASQIPTYLVCKLARQDVTVALSGDGGDELFAGYDRYVQGERIIAGLNKIPSGVRKAFGALAGAVSERTWDLGYRTAAAVVPGLTPHRLVGGKIRKLGTLLGHDSEDDMYRFLLSAWQNPESLLAESGTSWSRVEEELSKTRAMPLLDRMMLLDQQTYLPDDLLAKVDRASMAVSLEARVPLLDHRVVEFSWRLKPEHKVRNGRGKWLLRQVLYGLVEPELVDRPKMGFSVPIGDWLRGPLRDWAEELLFSSEPESRRYLQLGKTRPGWDGLQSGDDRAALSFWAVLMFESWRHHWIN